VDERVAHRIVNDAIAARELGFGANERPRGAGQEPSELRLDGRAERELLDPERVRAGRAVRTRRRLRDRVAAVVRGGRRVAAREADRAEVPVRLIPCSHFEGREGLKGDRGEWAERRRRNAGAGARRPPVAREQRALGPIARRAVQRLAPYAHAL